MGDNEEKFIVTVVAQVEVMADGFQSAANYAQDRIRGADVYGAEIQGTSVTSVSTLEKN